MQTACVIPSPLGFVCGSPSRSTAQHFLQSPPQQQKLPSTTPRHGRRRSAVQIFFSSVIQYATSDQSISPSSSSNNPSPSRLVEFKKRDMSSTTAQDCNHPQISLLSEMLQHQMIGGIGNRPDSGVSNRGIRFQCDNTKSKSVLNSTTTSRTTTPTPNSDVSGRKSLKFGDCPSVARRRQVQQPATILMNMNATQTPTIVNNGNELTNTPTLFTKRKLFSPPPTKSLLARVNDDDEEEEEEEQEEEEEKKDNSDDEDGYLEDDEDDDQEEEEDDDDDEEEEEDDGEELTPSNLISSFNSRTRPNTQVPILLIPKVATPTSSEQEQTTATTATSSYYSTALSILTPPNNTDRPLVRKAKSLPYRVTSGDTTTSDWAHHDKENMPPLAHRRRKLGVKSIPIPKNLHSHESCYSNTHKRKHVGQNRWSDIVSKIGGADKSKEEKEEDVLWPLSI